METKKHIGIRIYTLFLVAFIAFVYIILHIAIFQINQKEYWMDKANQYQIRIQNIHASRGSIMSDEEKLLSVSTARYDLRFDGGIPSLHEDGGKDFYDSVGIVAEHLARIRPSIHASSFRTLLTTTFNKRLRYEKILNDITFEEYQQIKKIPLIRMSARFGGFMFEKEETRSFLYGEMARRTIGLYRDGQNSVGIEKSFNAYLEGRSGKRMVKKIGRGAFLPIDEHEISPESGKDVVTTINVEMQDIASQSLRNMLSRLNAEWGTSVIMEVATGQIKAIANLRRQATGSYAEEFNYAVSNVEPGSTIKLISLMALLEDGHVDLDDTVNISHGTWKHKGILIKDSEHSNVTETTSVQHAFEISSNVGISKLINKYYADDPADFMDYFSSTTINQKVELHIPGEQAPEIKDVSDPSWSWTSLLWKSFGYEMKLSPISILTLYNGIANNGTVIEPYLIKEIRRDGQSIESFSPQVRKRSVCSNSTLSKIKKCLEGVVQNGTATMVKSSWYPIAGKTGTSKVYHADHGYSLSHYLGSFVGYFPANEPKYSCIVFIQTKPNSLLYYGANTALPVFKEIADRIMAKKYNQAVITAVAEQDKKVESDDVSLIQYKVMPDMKSWKLSDAVYFCESNNITIQQIRGKGKIITQSIKPGEDLNKCRFSSIILFLE